MLSEACYGILLHAFRRQSCRTRLNTDLRSDLSCSYTLVHKWFLDLPLDNGSRLRPSTEDVSVCPASMHPSALRRTREKNYWPRRSRYSSVANLMGTRWCDSCACVNLILRRTENLGEWSISLVREKTKLSFISQLVVTRPPRGGGYSWEFLVRVCRPVLQILTLFQTKKCNFPHLFSDQTSNVHTRFQTWPSGTNYVIIT